MHFCKGVSYLETHMDYFALWDWSCKKMTFPAHLSKWHTNGNFSLLLKRKNNLYMFLNLRYLYINNECSHLIFKMNGYYINNENLFFFSERRHYDSFHAFAILRCLLSQSIKPNFSHVSFTFNFVFTVKILPASKLSLSTQPNNNRQFSTCLR